jgi:hypothetical protein
MSDITGGGGAYVPRLVFIFIDYLTMLSVTQNIETGEL